MATRGRAVPFDHDIERQCTIIQEYDRPSSAYMLFYDRADDGGIFELPSAAAAAAAKEAAGTPHVHPQDDDCDNVATDMDVTLPDMGESPPLSVVYTRPGIVQTR
jgi:hypothetical protein